MGKLLTVQMKSETFDTAEPITILRFLKDWALACATNCVFQGAAMRLFHLDMENQARVVINASTCLQPREKRHQADGMLTTYCKVVHYIYPPTPQTTL